MPRAVSGAHALDGGRDRLLVGVARLVQAIEVLVGHAEVVPHIGLDRLELGGLLQRVDRVLVLPVVDERQAEVVLREARLRVELDRLFEAGDRVLALAALCSCTRPSVFHDAERVGAFLVAMRASLSARLSSPALMASRADDSVSSTPASSLSSTIWATLLGAGSTAGSGASTRTSGCFGGAGVVTGAATVACVVLGGTSSSQAASVVMAAAPMKARTMYLKLRIGAVSFRVAPRAAVMPGPKCARRAAFPTGVAIRHAMCVRVLLGGANLDCLGLGAIDALGEVDDGAVVGRRRRRASDMRKRASSSTTPAPVDAACSNAPKAASARTGGGSVATVLSGKAMRACTWVGGA